MKLCSATPSSLTKRQVELTRQDPGLGLPCETVEIDLQDGRRTRDFELNLTAGPEAQVALNVLAHAQRNWDTFSSYCSQIPPNWAHDEQRLTLYPDWDLGFNCFYSNGHSADMQQAGIYFCHRQDPVTGQMVYAGLSSELIAHEQGHAILDRFRPQWGLPGNYSFESSAFQEAFSDVLAMLLETRAPGVAEHALQQTGGDLGQHNLISDFAEQFGQGINHSQAGDSGGPWLRTALNQRKWFDPKGDAQAEIHDFGQIWSGSNYDLLCRLTRQFESQGLEPAPAMRQAAEEMLKCYGTFVSETAPAGRFSFRDAAQALMQADQKLGGRWQTDIREVMQSREIL